MTTAMLFAYETDDVRPGWVALVLVILLAIATFLLWRSMNKQLGKIDVPTKAEIDAANRDPGAGLPVNPDTREQRQPPTS